MKIAVIVPAAGVGKRFMQEASADPLAIPLSKIEMDLCGRPVFQRAVELFNTRLDVAQVLLAVNPDSIGEFRFKHGDALDLLGVTLVPGGRVERWETVSLALQQVRPGVTHVAVHDAARPLTSTRLIDRVFAAAEHYAAVIPGLPVNATLKRVTEEPTQIDDADPLDAILGSAGKLTPTVRRVSQTVDRRDVVEVQTPQVFEVSLLRKAYAKIHPGATDDASLVEALGEPVRVVEGEATNFKITRPEDLDLARLLHDALHGQQKKQTARKKLFSDEEDE